MYISTYKLNKMLDKLITSGTRRKILNILLTNPDSKYYLRELSRKTGEHPNAVRNELNRLTGIGLLRTEKIANLHYYYANKDFVLFNELKSIMEKTDPVINLISRVLLKSKEIFKHNLRAVVIFGSVARNEIRKDSDLDLIIICKELVKDWRKRDLVILELEKIGFEFGRSVHIELITEEEFEFSVREGAPLLFEVFKNNKIIYDKGFFKKQMILLEENIKKWDAKKIDKFTWEVPELAIKV